MSKYSAQELIRCYLDHDLSEEQEQVLVERLNTDSDFKQEWELSLALHQKEKDRLSLLHQKKKQPVKHWTKYLAAACVLALICTTVIYFFPRENLNEFVSHEIESDVFPPDILMGTNNSQAAWNKAKQAFIGQQYKEVLFELKLLSESKTLTDEQLHFQGLANMKIGDYTEAIEVFESLSDSRYEDEAMYYQLLCLLHIGEYDRASQLLDLLTDRKHFKSEQIERIQQLLRSSKN